MSNLPESSTSDRLSRIASEQRAVRQHLATLTMHTLDEGDVVAPLSASWQLLAGRPGVQIFHVPNPSGEAGLFLSICPIAPGTEFSGTAIDQSQLVGLMSGDLECNGRTYRAGQFLWLAPGEPANWKVRAGYLGAVLYDVPPHDIDPDLLPTS